MGRSLVGYGGETSETDMSMNENEKETRTVWVTKYALTKGIITKEARLSTWTAGVGGWNKGAYIYSGPAQFHLGYDAFLMEEDARVDAHQKRAKKIVSLMKQIKKLETLVF